jgi:choline-sulfatase
MPCLDRLAERAQSFSRAFCNAPVCTASRQSFLTGLYPHANGVTRLATPLDDSSVTVAERLAAAGYRTAAIGKMHFNSSLHHGFALRLDTPDWHAWWKRRNPGRSDGPYRTWRPFVDPAREWLNSDSRSEDLPAAEMDGTFLADRAIEYIEAQRASPWFLVVGFHEPHSPFRFPRDQERWNPADALDPPNVPDLERTNRPIVFEGLGPHEARGIRAAYTESLRFLDQNIGRVLDALERTGQFDRTLVVYLSDHGYLLGEHGRFEKHCSYEEAVRVPLLIKRPHEDRPGAHVSSLVELVDLAPTTLELAGVPDRPGMHGKSLTALLRGHESGENPLHEYVFSEYLENEEAMIRDRRFKLVVCTGARHRQDGYATADPTPGPWLRFFDLEQDPHEVRNAASDPRYERDRDRLLEALRDRLSTTRAAGDSVPTGLSGLAAIHWALGRHE